jgi:hypothetical protein
VRSPAAAPEERAAAPRVGLPRARPVVLLAERRAVRPAEVLQRVERQPGRQAELRAAAARRP